MLDINLLREDKHPNGKQIVIESEKKRFRDPNALNEIFELDQQWRRDLHAMEQTLQFKNKLSKLMGIKVKALKKEGKKVDMKSEDVSVEDADRYLKEFELVKADEEKVNQFLDSFALGALGKVSKVLQTKINDLKESVEKLDEERLEKWSHVGNLVHTDCPIFKEEDDNEIVKTFGEKKTKEQAPFNHVDLMEAIDGIDMVQGGKVAGSRGYYLKGDLVLLNMALIQYGLTFLTQKGYNPVQPPYFMNHKTMASVAQLDQFDEELYGLKEKKRDYLTSDKKSEKKMTAKQIKEQQDQRKYLIATSEQPLCALNLDKFFNKNELPLKYVGFSTCFRKEAGSHGRDTSGIFRVHQFEKIEQFCLTAPEDSWEMHEEMLKNSEEFYQALGLSYQVVNIVSGKLNNAAAKKLDLEAWFPASQTFRELVSCSNCTDYQSRRLGIRYRETTDKKGEFVHMLNSTLTATTRTMCCIVENYQTEKGIEIPKVLQPFMGGKSFIPFKQPPKSSV